MPLGRCVILFIFLSNFVLDGGIFHITQCTHVPIGASGSSSIIANDFVAEFALVQFNDGEMLLPSHVYSIGIVPPFLNELLVMLKAIALSPYDNTNITISMHNDNFMLTLMHGNYFKNTHIIKQENTMFLSLFICTILWYLFNK